MNRLPFLLPALSLVLGFLITTAPAASAQVPPAPAAGITVTGYGTAAAPAETAVVVLTVGSDTYMYAEGGMAPMPAEPTTPIVTADDIARPIIDALVAAGLPASSIEVISDPYAGGYGPYGAPLNVMIRFELENPTIDSITALLDPAIQAATSAHLAVTMTTVTYGIADCAPLNQQARGNAFNDARETAKLQAAALDMALGEVTASRDTPYMLYGGPYWGPAPINSCTPGVPDLDTLGIYAGAPFDPSNPAEVEVQIVTELTFEIAIPGAGQAETPTASDSATTTPVSSGSATEIAPVATATPGS